MITNKNLSPGRGNCATSGDLIFNLVLVVVSTTVMQQRRGETDSLCTESMDDVSIVVAAIESEIFIFKKQNEIDLFCEKLEEAGITTCGELLKQLAADD